MSDFHALPLTAEIWSDFERLFGPQGACYGCWCTHFRIPTEERKFMDGDAKKAFMRNRIERGPSPGIIGYLEGVPVGWVQVGPRSDVPKWNSLKTVSRPLDPADAEDEGVWAVTCFFITSRMRGKGLSHRMLSEAIAHAGRGGAHRLEACPIDRTKQSKSVGLYVGSTRIFEVAGFTEVARRKDGRPLMRLLLETAWLSGPTGNAPV